jgi:hypothetical protein
MDRIWGLTEVTPGAITASAIYVSMLSFLRLSKFDDISFQACYAFSNDVALQQQGSSSQINYEVDFNTYLQYLISGCSENRHSVKNIFQVYNYFFPSRLGLTATIGVVPTLAVDEVFAVLNKDDAEHSDGSSMAE